MGRKKKKNNNTIASMIVILAVILFIIMIILITIKNNSEENTEKNDNSINVVISSENIAISQNTTELEWLQETTERNRIEYYVRKFINYAEEGEYESAYELLNDEYKENYFPTISDFQEYISSTFTKMMDVEYTNIERNGEIYVVWLTLTDAINGGPDSGMEITFVVKETDFNEFELSFSVV